MRITPDPAILFFNEITHQDDLALKRHHAWITNTHDGNIRMVKNR